MAVRLTIRVIPGASQTKIVGRLGDVLKVRVHAPPEKGKANLAVINALAEALGISPKQLNICSGHTSRTKVVEIQGLSDAEVTRKISELAA